MVVSVHNGPSTAEDCADVEMNDDLSSISIERYKRGVVTDDSPGGRRISLSPIAMARRVSLAAVGELGAIKSEVMEDFKFIMRNYAPRREDQDDESVCEENLSHVIGKCLLFSTCMYGISDMRALVRQGKIEGDLTLPQGVNDCLRQFMEQREAIVNAGVNTEHYLSAVANIAQDLFRQSVHRRRSSIVSAMAGRELPTIIVFDDEHSTKELVYAITVDPSAKVIGVTFRGTKTIHDVMVDADMYQCNVRDPTFHDDEDQQGLRSRRNIATVGVHEGVHHYLFAEVEGPDGVKTTKYKVILGHLRSLLANYPPYKVVVTGHSLGGALATLLSFYVACEDDTPPVRCVTFASPRIGNIEFRRSYQKLEKNGRLQHVRVVNYLDPVPRMPDGLFCCLAFVPHVSFRHVGIELRLFPDGFRRKKSFFYPRARGSYLSQFCSDLWNATVRSIKTCLDWAYVLLCFWFKPAKVALTRNHLCETYAHRLEREGDELSALTTNGIYGTFLGEEAVTKWRNAELSLYLNNKTTASRSGDEDDLSWRGVYSASNALSGRPISYQARVTIKKEK